MKPTGVEVSPNVAHILKFFGDKKHPLLFAGAGVSARAGLPLWGRLLKDLAEWIRNKDPLVANKMTDLIHKGDLLRAADFFFLSDEVTQKEKYRILADMLKPTAPEKLSALCTLPVRGMVTTNFDRTLLNGVATAKHISPIDLRRGDESFRQASFTESFFVNRIHGFIENPESIVLRSADFEILEKDKIYQDVVVNLFTHNNVLLIGFSFTDPAILNVLQTINKHYGPLGMNEHLALVPEDIDGEILQRLNRLNIETLRYAHDPSDYTHEQLWLLIDKVAEELNRNNAATVVETAPEASSTSPFDTAKRYLASCFARFSLGSQVGPLRASIVEGMVSALVQKAAPQASNASEIAKTIHIDCGITLGDAEELVKTSLTALADEKLVLWNKKDRSVKWNGGISDTSKLDAAIQTLVQNSVDRAFVEEGYRSTSDVRKVLGRFFTQLILKRGWDLGAAFAAGQIPNGSDLRQLMFECAPSLPTNDVEILIRVCERLISNPSPREAEILATMGRASFGLELALQAPRSHMFHSMTLPSRIYLDANVVMPAFVYGHTFNPVYHETVESLKRATSDGRQTQICTTYGYLNEMVSHRNLAIQEYESDPDDFCDKAVREALFLGSSRLNVFVGAYANLVAADRSLTFPAFLQQYAPFSNEKELQRWLEQRGIMVITQRHVGSELFAEVSFELQKGYARSLRTSKDTRLLEHDAVQLAALLSDTDRGIKSIMVTADKRLREVVSDSRLRHITSNLLSHVGLTQLIDLLVGQSGDNRSLAHLLWDTTISRKSDEIRRYFTTLGLRHYDEAMAMELPAIVDQFSDRVLIEAKRQGIIDLQSNDNERKVMSIAGAFEDQFFEAIREKIVRRQSE